MIGVRRSVLEKHLGRPATQEDIEALFGEEEPTDELLAYRQGGEGMIKWCEDKVFVPIYEEGSDIAEFKPLGDLPDTENPKTGKSYRYIWEEQKKILKEALRMEKNRFVYRLVVVCWMRGDGKSLLAVLVQLWKFFNWPRQQIMLGANSRDQIKFVHYDIMRDIIINSPQLLEEVGLRNIQEKEIRIKDEHGSIRSLIRSISSFSGIVSNITGYTFSEIFDMKNPRFFVQLDGSIRNIPNALGIIDSTVSDKTHLLYNLYHGWSTGKLKTVYFSYRYSKGANVEDYWNPNMDEDQLSDYQVKFPFGEFEKYFQNLWSAGTVRVFTDEMIEEMGYIGTNERLLDHQKVSESIQEKVRLQDVVTEVAHKGFQDGVEETFAKIHKIEDKLKRVETVYTLDVDFGRAAPAGIEDLDTIGKLLDTDWCILVGLDMHDPMAVRGKARTILSVIAKGLPGSKSTPHLVNIAEAAPRYVYFLLCLYDNQNHTLDVMKELMDQLDDEYDGIDSMCAERYGAWDMASWAEDRDIPFEPIFPNYDRQRAAFKELYTVMKEGRFKAPAVPVLGSKKEDVLREEMEVFDHDPDDRWFGSPEKTEKYGIQDDSIYSIGWGLYGGRDLSVDDFRMRRSILSFGTHYPGHSTLGVY
jgi:hypothetical protein